MGYESNLDSENIRNYFGSRSMDVIDRGERVSQAYKVISVVTGDSCQRSRQDPPASASEARNQMREQAYRFQADAIISSQCYQLPADDEHVCYSNYTCFGQAVQWLR
ncbi:MAG: Rcs stress response system protein RcsF [Idiomarina sp.]